MLNESLVRKIIQSVVGIEIRMRIEHLVFMNSSTKIHDLSLSNHLTFVCATIY